MQEFAIAFMILSVLVIIAVDVALALNRYRNDTFSSILRFAGRKYIGLIILMVFGMGLLAGHWWW